MRGRAVAGPRGIPRFRKIRDPRCATCSAPGNIVAEIAALNRIRRANPALQSHLGVAFYNAFNDQVLLYGKMAPSRAAMILVAISLDPHLRRMPRSSSRCGSWACPTVRARRRGPDARAPLHLDRQKPARPAEPGRSAVRHLARHPAGRCRMNVPLPRRCRSRPPRRSRKTGCGTRTPSSISCMSNRSSTPTTTASATFPACWRSWTTSPTLGVTRSGCCRSILRRGWMTATTSATIAACIPITAPWPT